MTSNRMSKGPGQIPSAKYPRQYIMNNDSNDEYEKRVHCKWYKTGRV